MTLGVFLIGLKGNVGTCTVVGARAIARGLLPSTGMVTAQPEFAALDLAAVEALVFGGCDVASHTLLDSARRLAREGVIPHDLLDPLADDLVAVEAACAPALTLPGPDDDPGAPLAERLAVFARRLDRFREQSGADDVVVVNLAPTEPTVVPRRAHESLSDLDAAIAADDRSALSESMAYAYAALDAGCPYVNFTPSRGASVPALEELARLRGVPHAGQDGKTGETLLKTVLAPMFVARNLHVMTWEGRNLLGNADGRALADPDRREAKLATKDVAVRHILAGQEPPPHVHTDISYTPSLGDYKTAWDLIHFRGFLGVSMTLQLTWQGCDSALAAPLVLDLARLLAHAHAQGHAGAQPQLASFFKRPVGTDEQDFFAQLGLLRAYIADAAAVPQSDTA